MTCIVSKCFQNQLNYVDSCWEAWFARLQSINFKENFIKDMNVRLRDCAFLKVFDHRKCH